MRRISWLLGAVALLAVCPARALPPKPDVHASGVLLVPEAAVRGVVSAPLAPKCLHTTLQTAGRITYDDLKVARILSPVSGRVAQVLAKPGDALVEGGVLATIHSPDYATARADWHKAQVALQTAQKDLARQDGLFKRHAAPEQVVLAAWDVYRRAVSERDRTRANLALLGGGHSEDKNDAVYRLRTPIAGVVVSRAVHPGMEVAGQYGGGSAQELFVVADLSQVWVVAEVPEADVGRIGRAAQVEVRVDALPNTPLTATLDYVADTLDPKVHTGHVRCVVPNVTGKLKPDMYATLTIQAAGTMALAVPQKSLVHMLNTAFVYIEHDPPKGASPGVRAFERRHVVADEVDQSGPVAISQGLAPEERLVIEGAETLRALQEPKP